MEKDKDKLKAEVFKLVKKHFGANPIIQATIMANIEHETGGTFDYEQLANPRSDGTREPAFGLFQFNFHQPYYEAWLKENKLSNSAESQIKYVSDAIYREDSQPAKNWGRKHSQNTQELLRKRSGKKEGEYDKYEVHNYLLENFFRPSTPHADRRKNLFDKYYEEIMSVPIPESPFKKEKTSSLEEKPSFEFSMDEYIANIKPKDFDEYV